MNNKLQLSKSVIAIVVAFVVALTGSLAVVFGMNKTNSGTSTSTDLSVSGAADSLCTDTGCTDPNHTKITSAADLYNWATNATITQGCITANFDLDAYNADDRSTYSSTLSLTDGRTLNGHGKTINVLRSRTGWAEDTSDWNSQANLRFGLIFNTIESGSTVENLNITYTDRSYHADAAMGKNETGSVHSFGILAGRNEGTIQNVALTMTTATIEMSYNTEGACSYIGGLVGWNYGSGAKMINVSAYISGNKDGSTKEGTPGTIIATMTGSSRWSNFGDQTGYAGGLVGYNSDSANIYGATVELAGGAKILAQEKNWGTYDPGVYSGGVLGAILNANISGVYLKSNMSGVQIGKDGTGGWGLAHAVIGRVHEGSGIVGCVFADSDCSQNFGIGDGVQEGEDAETVQVNENDYTVDFIYDSEEGVIKARLTPTDATKQANANRIYWAYGDDDANNANDTLVNKYEDKLPASEPIAFVMEDLGLTNGAFTQMVVKYGEHVLQPVVESDLEIDNGTGLYQKTYDGQEHYVTVRYDVKSYTSEELNGVFQTLYDVRNTEAGKYTMPADAIKPTGTVVETDNVRLYISYTALVKVADLNISPAPLEFSVENSTVGLLDEITPSVKGNLVAGHKVKVQAKDNMIIGNTIKFNTAGTFELVPEVWNASTNVTRNYEFINNSSRINVKVDPIGIILDKGISPRFGFEKNQDGEYIIEDGKYKINSRYIEVNVKCFTANSSVESVFAGDYELTANDPNIKDTWYKGTIEKKTDKITAKYVNDKYNVSIIGGTALPNDDAVTEGVTNIDCAYGDRLVLRADSVENFSYWKVNGVMMSTSAEYEIVVRQGMEIEAVNDGTIQDEIIIRYENLNGDVLEMHRLPSNADILAYVNGEILSGKGLVNYTNYELYREWAGTWTVYSTYEDGVYVARPDMQASDDEGAVQKVNVTYNGKTVAYDFNSVVTLDAGEAVSWYVDGQMVRYGVPEYTFTAIADCEITTDYSEDYATGVTLTAYTEGLGESGKSAKVYFASTFGTDMFYDQNGGDYTDVNIRVLVYRKGESVEVAYSAVVTSYNVNTYQFIRGMSFDETGEFEAVVEFEYYGETITSAKVEFTLA